MQEEVEVAMFLEDEDVEHPSIPGFVEVDEEER